MSILTNRELEFLVSLNTDWRKLYWSELARLQERDGVHAGPADRTASGSRHAPDVRNGVSQTFASARGRALT